MENEQRDQEPNPSLEQRLATLEEKYIELDSVFCEQQHTLRETVATMRQIAMALAKGRGGGGPPPATN